MTVADRTYPARGLHGRVVHSLGLRIVGGAYEVGEALPNGDALGAELGVSRTVVREAVKVLIGKGLVEVRPKLGTRVRARRSWHLLDPDVLRWQFENVAVTDDWRELLEVQESIGPTAARLAAERHIPVELMEIQAALRRLQAALSEPDAFRTASLDFNEAIFAASHNTLLWHVNAVIRLGLESGSSDTRPVDEDEDEALGPWQDLVESIERRDGAGSEKAMRNLLTGRYPSV
jgi:DNA-binding FadR family transcriptional regulator